MTGPHGIYQHARGAVPDLAHGTCTDDVARALGVDLLHARVIGWPAVATSARRSLDYLVEAFDDRTGRFRNFRADDGTWLPGEGSQDCQGRAMLALAEAAAGVPDPREARQAAAVLAAACAAAAELTALRAIASAVVACVIADGARGEGSTAAEGGAPAHHGATRPDPVRTTLELLARRLAARLRDVATDPAWPWPEPAVTYESVLVPRALLAAGTHLGRPDLVELGRVGLDWLIASTIDAEGRFHPVGNRGWWRRGASPARFDQQPIEAGAMVMAVAGAHEATGHSGYLAAAEAAYAWFLGRNDLDVALAIPGRGACRDGLGPEGPNQNQGAESTLAWLAAVEHLRWLRDRTGGEVGAPAGALTRR